MSSHFFFTNPSDSFKFIINEGHGYNTTCETFFSFSCSNCYIKLLNELESVEDKIEWFNLLFPEQAIVIETNTEKED